MDVLDDDMTEVVNAKIPRVDLVSKAANGLKFIFMKSDDTPNLLDADSVRELLKQAQEGDMTDTTIDAPDEVVAKADEDILEDAPAGAEGDVTDPGSPAWEAVDAATAWAILAQLNDVKRALDCLTDREGAEAFNGDEDGYDNAWDLSTASEQVDCVIAIVAPYAVGEQDESEQPVEKSVDRVGAVEVLTQFVKAGRALSASNESALRGAAASIQNVLNSLPALDEPVTKADEMTDELIEKAKGDPQLLVYALNSSVPLGSIDPESLTTFAAATDAPTEDAPDDAPDDAPEDAPVDAPAEDAPTEDAPVAPESAVIPGTDTVQSPVVADDTTVTKALTSEFTVALTEALAPFAKQAEDNLGLADLVKSLQERVELLSKMPDDRNSPRLGGGTGTVGMANRDGLPVDGLADLRKAVEEATPAKKVEAQSALAFAALKANFS